VNYFGHCYKYLRTSCLQQAGSWRSSLRHPENAGICPNISHSLRLTTRRYYNNTAPGVQTTGIVRNLRCNVFCACRGANYPVIRPAACDLRAQIPYFSFGKVFQGTEAAKSSFQGAPSPQKMFFPSQNVFYGAGYAARTRLLIDGAALYS